MQNITDRLIEDMKNAMRAKNTQALEAIRFLRSEIKNAQIDAGKALEDSAVMQIIAKQVKQMSEAIEEFKKAGRADIVKTELEKLAVMRSYLPEQLSEDKIKEIVSEIKKSLSQPNLGSLIAEAKKKIGASAQSSQIAKIAKELLG